MTKKILVVGWDGASHKHIQEINPSYYSSLDNKGRLLPEPLYEGIPIDSGTAWTTLTTGVDVEDHGVISINNVVEDRELLAETKYVGKKISWKRLRTYFYYGLNKLFNLKKHSPKSTDILYKRLWEYIDGKTLALGVPLTYPAWEQNGVMLSGIPAPLDAEKPSSYPEEYEKYRQRYKGYYYLGDKTTPLQDKTQPNFEEYKEQIYECNDEAFEVVRELDEDEDFELIFAVFPVIDDLLHAFDEQEDWQEIVEAYHWLDSKTEQLEEDVEPDHTVLISDHGMKPASESLNPNTYPGVKMEHDSENGMWASNTDIKLERQKDLVPELLGLLGKEFIPEKADTRIKTSESDEKKIKDKLEALGYADQ